MRRDIKDARSQLAGYEGWLAYFQAAGSEIACHVYIRAIERIRKYLVREGEWR